MKKIFLSAIIALITITAFAQNVDSRRKIEVNGTAETEVTPDEIYFGISLKEYFKENKKKVSIQELETQLQKAVIKAGIANEDFMINDISAYNNYWDRKKNPSFLASKQYSIKLKDLNKLNEIIASVDPKGIAYSNIERYAYSKEEELKRDLKIKALKQAKDKATYLVESLGDKLYRVLEIYESDNSIYPKAMYRDAMMVEVQEASMPNIDFKKIKIAVQIRAIFELK